MIDLQTAGSETVSDQIATLQDMPRAVLSERWRSTYGRPPPKGVSRRLLEHAAAHALQARANGGLKPKVRRQLRYSTRSDRADSSHGTASKRPALGSRLVREWRGRTYTVDVLEAGFHYEGQYWSSLSEVARAITGARWSGPRFFGL